MGVVGALFCAIGMLMVSGSVVGAAAGHDAQTSYLFLMGTFICDFGSLLNSFSFMGLIWHFPGKQTVVLSLINATYQASALLPMVVQAAMEQYHFTLSSIMFAWTGVVFATVYFCWLLTPSQAEYYQQAKKVLGMPLPKPPTELKPCEMMSRCIEVLQQHRQDHWVSGFTLSLGFLVTQWYPFPFFSSRFPYTVTNPKTGCPCCHMPGSRGLIMPLLYSSEAAPYGEVLFGHKADGEKLAEVNVLCTAILGSPEVPFFEFLFLVQGSLTK